MFAEPSTVSASSATTVCPGGCAIHHGRASSSERSSAKAYVRPAATIDEKKG
jgi:hypothetical protein